ncbi:MAG: DEAD/DEAH box helicase family protein [Chlamydiae bacterium]|nr:DEAD/DEAH box helicase family protein [Chlamydiota bacterium]
MKLSSQEFVDSVFSQEGILSKILKDYELREEQRQMSLQILEAYEKEKIALIEAGTGVGKSWAYLIPAIYWAITRGEQTVISTHTIPLQEQLTEKDIPFLLKALNVDIQPVLVKGMSNYLCLKKLHEASNDRLSLLPEEQNKLSELQQWSEVDQNGSYSDVPFPVPQFLWDQVSADRSSCTNVQCPQYKECFFFKARKKMSEAQLLIVNHHLLMAEISSKVHAKGKEEKSLLPKFYRLVVDEAHHLDEIALESFARKNDRIDLVRWLGRLYSDHHPEKSRCLLFLKDLIKLEIKNPSLQIHLQTDLLGQKRDLVLQIEELFKRIEFFSETYLKADRGSESKEVRFRLKPEHFLSEYWQTQLKPLFIQVADSLVKMAMQLGNLRSDIGEPDKAVIEKLSVHLQEIEFVAQTISEKAQDLRSFTLDENDITRVRWIELTGFMSNIMLVDAHLNVAAYLKQHLFDPRVSSILCSATLTSSSKFSYVKERIGLAGKLDASELSEKIYPSPFDYQNRVLLAVPKDISLPSDPGFIKEAAEMICKAVIASRGSCFVLFTSYDMLRQVYRLVEEKLKDFTLLKQGDASRQVLIEKFKAKEGNVLFATDSFWEGVDVPGEALRCVIIVKLPFKVPSDPIYQAFSEMYEKGGKDSFSGYSLPSASIKFKQGFGRLIRKNTDRGCILCLDKRLMTKSYGSTFLKSIPNCKKAYEDADVLFKMMKEFYVKTEVRKK